MVSLDILWASSSLDSFHVDPEPTADEPTAPSRRQPTHPAEYGSDDSVSEVCLLLDASEGPCLHPAWSSGKPTVLSKSLALLPSLFFCSLDTTLLDVDLTIFWSRMSQNWRRIYLNGSKVNYLQSAWSRGKPKSYDLMTFCTINLFVSCLLFQGVIFQVGKEKNFVSFPFVVPKKPGERSRFIVDYGHFKDKKLYLAPKFRLMPILASPAAVSTFRHAVFFAKIDLRDAFHAMLLPRSLYRVSTFKFCGKFHQFRRLPMGLFLSPFLL